MMAAPDNSRDRGGRQNPAEIAARLLEAAAAAFVQHGYEGARVSEIARNAGVTVGAVYARWPNKTAVMVAAVDHIFQADSSPQRIEDMGLNDLSLPETREIVGSRIVGAELAERCVRPGIRQCPQ